MLCLIPTLRGFFLSKENTQMRNWIVYTTADGVLDISVIINFVQLTMFVICTVVWILKLQNDNKARQIRPHSRPTPTLLWHISITDNDLDNNYYTNTKCVVLTSEYIATSDKHLQHCVINMYYKLIKTRLVLSVSKFILSSFTQMQVFLQILKNKKDILYSEILSFIY